MPKQQSFPFLNLCLALIIAAGCLFVAQPPITVFAAAQGMSTTYQQNFDNLVSSGSATWTDDSTLSGWYTSRTTIAADDGSSGTGGLYSYGTNGSSERGLGSQPKNNTGTIYTGVLLRNDSGQAISQLYIAYTGEQWRNGGGATQDLLFSYQISASPITSLSSGTWTSVSALNFISPITGGIASALDGNLAANQSELSAVLSLALPENSYIMLRWSNPNDQGADHGLAVDDLIVSRDLPPQAIADAYAAEEDIVLNVSAMEGVLANDSDPEGNPLTAALVTQPAHGQVSMNPDGSFAYTPVADYNGTDSFIYAASDGDLRTRASVTLTIAGVNDAPIAAPDAYNLQEDQFISEAVPGVLDNDSDIDGDVLTAILVDTTTHGSLTLNADGSFDYQPDGDWNGEDSFTYQASDGELYSAAETVTLQVQPVNDAPQATGDAYCVDEDLTLEVVPAASVLTNDNDLDGDGLTAELVSEPAHGTLLLSDNGTFSYTPASNWNGEDSFTYAASDGQLQSETVTVTLTVNPVNDAPDAVADAYTIAEDDLLTIPATGVLGNDSDVENDTLQAVLDQSCAHGSLTLNADGSFTYQPDADWNGEDSFSYHAFDGAATSDPVTVAITVNPVNDAPYLVEAIPDQSHTARSSYNFNVKSYFTDIDAGDVLSFSAQLENGDPLPAWLSFDAASGELSGTPTNAEAGSYIIQISVSDGLETIFDNFVLTVETDQFLFFIPMVCK
jgi:VCBS repeat-containing protein